VVGQWERGLMGQERQPRKTQRASQKFNIKTKNLADGGRIRQWFLERRALGLRTSVQQNFP